MSLEKYEKTVDIHQKKIMEEGLSPNGQVLTPRNSVFWVIEFHIFDIRGAEKHKKEVFYEKFSFFVFEGKI